MTTSLRATKVSFWWSLRKAAFQLRSVRKSDPSSPRAAGVSPEETACASENAGPKADAAVAKTAARIRSRRLIRGYGIAVLRLSKFPFHEMINANQRFLKNNARQQANRALALSLRSNGSPSRAVAG